MQNEKTVDVEQAYVNILAALNTSVKKRKPVPDKTEDDKTFREQTTDQISNRDEKYTELLNHFVRMTKVRNVLKEIFKWLFYVVIISAIVVLVVIICLLFYKYISSASIEQMTESMPLLITSMVGFVSTIITIPVAITKYLFSTKEDENITQIILHTQEHDTSGRQWAMEYIKKEVEDQKEAKVQKEAEASDKKGAAG